jgi:hypothetical protein
MPGSVASGTHCMIIQSKHKIIFNNVQFATCFGYSNHHQANISVHGHDMFSAYSMGSHIIYIWREEYTKVVKVF